MMVISVPALALDSNVNSELHMTESFSKAPRSFSKTYEDVNLTSSSEVLMSDTNWWNERTVTVTLDKISKNATVYFTCYTRKSSDGKWSYLDSICPLSLSDPSDKFDLPSGVQFQIKAYSSEACNADIIVSLS